MSTESLIVYIKTDYIYKDIADDVETRIYTSNYELVWNSSDRPLPKGKNKKVIRLMKDELGGKITTKFVALRVNTYCYSIDEDRRNETTKSTQKCAIKKNLKFENYKNCLEATQLGNKIKYLGKNNVSIDSI